jgi:hypothetical protein
LLSKSFFLLSKWEVVLAEQRSEITKMARAQKAAKKGRVDTRSIEFKRERERERKRGQFKSALSSLRERERERGRERGRERWLV